MNRLVHHPITAWADALRQPTVRSIGTTWDAAALDDESAAVDPAHRGFGASSEAEKGKQYKPAHFGSRKSDEVMGRFTPPARYMPTGQISTG